MMADKYCLKSCPFCGGEEIEIINNSTDKDDDDYWANCVSCGALLGGAETPEDTVDEWNYREKEQQLEAENKRLRFTLEKYGKHKGNCAYIENLSGNVIVDCDCGLAQALQESK